jgi:hypothetical protein
MKQFEKITQNAETLAEFLAVTDTENNIGCAGCDWNKECKGKETCKTAWEEFLNSEE